MGFRPFLKRIVERIQSREDTLERVRPPPKPADRPLT
jgi:hypothetical protein